MNASKTICPTTTTAGVDCRHCPSRTEYDEKVHKLKMLLSDIHRRRRHGASASKVSVKGTVDRDKMDERKTLRRDCPSRDKYDGLVRKLKSSLSIIHRRRQHCVSTLAKTSMAQQKKETDVPKKVVISTRGWRRPVRDEMPHGSNMLSRSNKRLMRQRLRGLRDRDLKVSDVCDRDSMTLNAHNVRCVVVERCEDVRFVIRGSCARFNASQCKRCVFVLDELTIKAGKIEIVACQELRFEIPGVPIVTAESSRDIELGVADERASRVYTARCTDVKLLTKRYEIYVPPNQPRREASFLITYFNKNREKMITEVGVRYGLLVLPKSEIPPQKSDDSTSAREMLEGSSRSVNASSSSRHP